MGRVVSATALLAELRDRGIELRYLGDRILYRPREAVSPDLRAELQKHREEVIALLRQKGIAPPLLNVDQAPEEPDLDRFLEDDSISAALFYSKALDRQFLIVRDEAALAALLEADAKLPVLYFEEAKKLARLGLEGLRVMLDFRAEFGPLVALERAEVSRE